jgi:two-component system, NtrC family, response regulator GlrR
VDATRRGVFGYLTKPYEARVLLDQVARALRIGGGTENDERSAAEVETWREGIITRNQRMEDVLAQAKLVAAGDASVFIFGESGAGKEMLARAIHRASPRAVGPFIAVNCGAIPEPLLESELFGHVKGSFTGAIRDHEGLFQAAGGGTLFLDEIGDMPLPLQVKLLRVIEDRHVRPVGSTRSLPVDVRIISATHRDLEKERAAGNFREDLYYRLNVVSLSIPALGERREDIPLLAVHLLKRLAERYDKRIKAFSPEAMELLVNASWPGNVRQLYNVVEQTVALCTTGIIPPNLVQNAIQEEQSAVVPLEDARREFERDYLVRVLKLTGGNVTQAARLAKRNRTEFYKLLQRHALEPALFKLPPQ